jgi:hypothetical protein
VNCLTSVFLSPLVCVFGVVYRLPALNLLRLVIPQQLPRSLFQQLLVTRQPCRLIVNAWWTRRC